MKHIPLPEAMNTSHYVPKGPPAMAGHGPTPEMQARMARDRQLKEARRPLAEQFSVGTVPCGEITMPYRLYVPEKLEPGKAYPLVLFFHGGGERGNDNSAQLLANEGALSWVRDQMEDPEKACFVLAPQLSAGAEGWLEAQLLAVNAALEAVLAAYPVDENRLYLTGMSLGGAACWYMNFMYPGRFAAATACCPAVGNTPEQMEPSVCDALASAFVGRNLWLFHAEDDPVVPVGVSRRLVDALTAQGGCRDRDFFYTEYPAEMGLSHGCWEAAYELGLMRRWLLAQDLSLPPMPEHPGKPDEIPPEMREMVAQMERERTERTPYLPRFREGIQTRDGISVRYRLYVPEGLGPEKKYPMIVFLHGIGECGNDNIAPLVASDGGTGWVAAQDRGEIGPCFVLVPQCPNPIPGLRWEEEYLRLVGDALTELAEALPVDEKRVYATGLSLGGYGVWNLVRMFPGRFAAAVTCCPACVAGSMMDNHVDEAGLANCAQALKEIPLWLFHAEDDPAVPVTVTKAMDSRLQSLGRRPGGDYHVTIYPAERHYGHACWGPALSSPEMRQWLLSQ